MSDEALTCIKPLFTLSALLRHIVPLVVEQFLLMTVGMVDTIMVTTAGAAAVSSNSLVGNINTLFIQIYAVHRRCGGSVQISWSS